MNAPVVNERRRCAHTGKVIYTSKQTARKAMGKRSRRMRAYLCPHCRYWHLTSQIGNRK